MVSPRGVRKVIERRAREQVLVCFPALSLSGNESSNMAQVEKVKTLPFARVRPETPSPRPSSLALLFVAAALSLTSLAGRRALPFCSASREASAHTERAKVAGLASSFSSSKRDNDLTLFGKLIWHFLINAK